jgi:3,4-dihydroxy 2-butanone 4-phosphate synthase / GTP cyclohydrolase II
MTGMDIAFPSQTRRDAVRAGLRRPGHVFPRPGGLAERRGHTEASVELMRLCGLGPVAVISEVCEDDGDVARMAGLRAFAGRQWLTIVSIEEIAAVVRVPEVAGGVG